ncbi:putative RNA polymerase II subunit B1 CTD phosphatase RPAP2 [Anthonomus grandis grandis]|uniref:putative RNA polymerase II subunit B1 CTD phosphatase RPAP2 n=1 Tax=Anthonomus grandis grandis TaxID=2921223 RepID=UPI0021661E43|nr:putative RNA polymerase II subunit B1 CTD phosphatase RPAP2 [Anthonomus grandis grandis]
MFFLNTLQYHTFNMQDSLEDYLKFTRNAKTDDPLKISKEMVVTAQLKKECDNRAMKIVEFSIEGKLRPEVFIKCLPFINQTHYEDIVEERAISKLCGYSVCGKKIPEMPKKQYFISTKSNKVYDITQRKNFCSNFCYKASLHIKKQLDNSPLWLRKLEDIPEYKLLHPSEGGLPGELIDQGIVKPANEVTNFTSINCFAQASLGDITERNADSSQSKKTRNFKRSSMLKSSMQTIKETEIEEEKEGLGESTKVTKKIEQKKVVKVAKKETHKRHCIVSLPSIEENEEKSKENDCVIETTAVIVKQEIMQEVNPERIKQERLDLSENPSIDQSQSTQSQVLTETTNIVTCKTEFNPIIKMKELSIKAEPPEKIKTVKPKSEPLENSQDNNGAKTKKSSKKKDQEEPTRALGIESLIRNSFDDWITLETCIFIHGETKVKHILNENKLSEYFDQFHVQELQREQQMRYMEICRRLQLQEMADDRFDKVYVGGTKLKPLPDFKKLKEESKELKLKVKAFFEGRMYEGDDKGFSTDDNKKLDEEESPPAVLPPVDVHSQNLLRRKIFLNSLNKAIQQLLQSLGASYTSVLSDIQALVKTFKLKADNITFKPFVWNYIALVLLHLLSMKEIYLKEILEEQRSQEFVHVLLDNLPSKREFISKVLSNVENVELFVQHYITKKDSNYL